MMILRTAKSQPAPEAKKPVIASDKNAAVFLAHELCYQQQSHSGNIENAKVRLYLQQINRMQMAAAGL